MDLGWSTWRSTQAGCRSTRCLTQPPEPDFQDLPGGRLVAKGLADLADGRTTVESLLIGCASIRLRTIGLPVPGPTVGIEQDLYRLIEAEVGEARAHSRYNALRRRLVSFIGSARDASRG